MTGPTDDALGLLGTGSTWPQTPDGRAWYPGLTRDSDGWPHPPVYAEDVADIRGMGLDNWSRLTRWIQSRHLLPASSSARQLGGSLPPNPTAQGWLAKGSASAGGAWWGLSPQPGLYPPPDPTVATGAQPIVPIRPIDRPLTDPAGGYSLDPPNNAAVAADANTPPAQAPLTPAQHSRRPLSRQVAAGAASDQIPFNPYASENDPNAVHHGIYRPGPPANPSELYSGTLLPGFLTGATVPEPDWNLVTFGDQQFASRRGTDHLYRVSGTRGDGTPILEGGPGQNFANSPDNVGRAENAAAAARGRRLVQQANGGPITTAAYLGAVAAGADEKTQNLATDIGAAGEGALIGAGAFGPRQAPRISLPSRTRSGVPRNPAAYWRATRDLWDQVGYEDLLSPANRDAIARGRSPVVDEAWVHVFPEDEGLMGEQIKVHHIRASPLQVPLPASRHRDAHMPGGSQTNHGGPGGGLPVYPRKSVD
ncbi:MAG: hypothetical protein ACRDQZ_07590, partial [Mycobacteriales bacterium]